MKITFQVEDKDGGKLSDSYSFDIIPHFPTSQTDMNEEINGMIEALEESKKNI